MNSLTMEMTKLGLQPTKKMYSLSMEAALQANNLEVDGYLRLCYASCLPNLCFSYVMTASQAQLCSNVLHIARLC